MPGFKFEWIVRVKKKMIVIEKYWRFSLNRHGRVKWPCKMFEARIWELGY